MTLFSISCLFLLYSFNFSVILFASTIFSVKNNSNDSLISQLEVFNDVLNVIFEEENTIFTPVFYIILTVSILTVTAVILFVIVLKKRRAHFGKNS